ncbi:2-oxoacid ferredoxin oxidoreductase [candidate division KSB1 bacterium]|nr:2-oxoacid ferredoxin oxidoreductase [candidate division KSB1 bacterium]
MDKQIYNMENIDIAWCPGCGNFGIRNVLMQVMADIGLEPNKTVIVSGIGQAAKMPHYVRTHAFNGLHGRALPAAVAIKAVNPELTVIVDSGDGDMYGEGGNHFIHNIRRNANITAFIHNNMVYGLTKGQASPTSQRGFQTPVQVNGVILEPFNPVAVAIALDTPFVARANIGDRDQAGSIFKQAIEFNGFSVVDVFQPCVTYNKVNTYDWFKENTYSLDDSYYPSNRNKAFQKAIETDPLPLGVIYKNENKKTFENSLSVYEHDKTVLYERAERRAELQALIDSYQ